MKIASDLNETKVYNNNMYEYDGNRYIIVYVT